jgi:hypothetical protein
VRKNDRPRIDPFRIEEAEWLIAAIHRDWGEAQGNYDEFRFFTGLRPSEQIALLTSDYDPVQGTISVTKACVGGIDQDCTKTGDDRVMVLCPRASEVLTRHFSLRCRMVAAGLTDHDHLFFQRDGAPIQHLRYAYHRWKKTLQRAPAIRYRRPYAARHSSVSWNLMIGSSPLWVAKQHGHSVATMFRAYAAWTGGASESEIGLIKKAMGLMPHERRRGPSKSKAHPLRGGEGISGKLSEDRIDSPTQAADQAAVSPQLGSAPAPSFGTISATTPTPIARKSRRNREIYGGKGGTRTRRDLLEINNLLIKKRSNPP